MWENGLGPNQSYRPFIHILFTSTTPGRERERGIESSRETETETDVIKKRSERGRQMIKERKGEEERTDAHLYTHKNAHSTTLASTHFIRKHT